MIWRIFLFLLLAFVSIAGIAFPIVEKPSAWYEFPIIPGLEENAKIIFFHVPTAWLTVIAFLMSTIFSFRYLRNKNLDEDAKAYSAAQLGMIFCILATITGAVWAKFAWGQFWSWDPRQTSIFAILLIYGALFALRSSIESEDKRATLSAVYSMIAFVTVPFFIFIMPRLIVALHPDPIINIQGKISMDSVMLIIFLSSLFTFTLLYFWIFNIKVRYEKLKFKKITVNWMLQMP